MSEWIYTKDQCPKSDVPVLVSYTQSNGYCSVGIAYYYKRNEMFAGNCECFNFPGNPSSLSGGFYLIPWKGDLKSWFIEDYEGKLFEYKSFEEYDEYDACYGSGCYPCVVYAWKPLEEAACPCDDALKPVTNEMGMEWVKEYYSHKGR